MHGQNAIRKLQRDAGEKLQVREIFATVQGEGPMTGMRAVFIRLTGCHLACTFCDTEWDDERDPLEPVEIIARRAFNYWDASMGEAPSRSPPLFVLTGGEPTRQELGPLFRELLTLNPEAVIQVETAGSFWRECLAHPQVSVVVSPKTPYVHRLIEKVAVAYKYVVRANDAIDPRFGVPITSTQGRACAEMLACPSPLVPLERIYLQPCDEGDEERNKANLMRCCELAMRYGYRVSVQLQKLAGMP